MESDFFASNLTGWRNEVIEENRQIKKPIGVSEFLPPFARTTLVNAAKKARLYEEGELERIRIIEKAIKEVHAKYPEFFTEEGRASSS